MSTGIEEQKHTEEKMEVKRKREEKEEVEEDKTASQNQERRGKSCKGTLYYSSLLKSKGINPRCVGFTRSLQQGYLSLCFRVYFIFLN